jgi:putative transcriptional regulator
LPNARSRRAPSLMCATPMDEDDAPPSLDGKDWREVRAVLQAGGVQALAEERAKADRDGFHAFPLSLPEQGCCLASHPAFYRRNRTYLTQSVVFVTRHDETGSIGLVLNRPLAGTAAKLESTGLFGRSTTFRNSALANAPVYLGGSDALIDDAPVAVIHAAGAGLNRTIEPLAGVFTSSIDVVMPLIHSGELKAEQVRLFSGCIRWRPGQLRSEVESGEWFAASASSAFPLSPCIGLTTPLWRELMQVLSPVHAKIAQKVYGEESE